MSLKVCFNDQIHKLSKLPETFKILRDYIISLYPNQLPQAWALQYTDSDGDNIMLADEHDYQSMKEDQFGAGAKTTKIYIIPVKQSMNQSLQQSKANISEIVSNDIKPDITNNNVDVIVISKDDIDEPAAIEETKETIQKEEEWHNVNPKQNKSSKKASRKSLSDINNSQFGESSQNIGEEFVIKRKEEKPPRKNKEKYLHHLDEKETKKKANLREEIRSVLADFVPIIASLAKDLLKQEMVDEQKESQNMKVSKSFVSQEKHEGVFCNGCNQQDFMGTRYKCSVCPDFDYCETCEAEKEHPHPFIMMRKPLSFSFHPISNECSNSKTQKKSPHKQSSEKHEDVKKVKEESKESPRLVNAPPEGPYLAYSGEDEEEDEEGMNVKHKNVGYSKEVKEKAKKLQEIFSFAEVADLRKFVSQAPEMSLEELIEKMLLQ